MQGYSDVTTPTPTRNYITSNYITQNNLQGSNNDSKLSEQQHYFMGGFFEGEGSASISAKVNEDRKTKVQLQPEVNVAQLNRGVHILKLFQKLFGGSIGPKSKGSSIMVWKIYQLKVIVEQFFPWYETYVMPFSGKISNYEIFKAVCMAQYRNEHHDPTRLKE